MRNKKKISAIVLAGTMMLSMGTTALADDIPTVNEENTVSITKDFVMAEGIATPDATFKFTAISATPGAPEATINDLEFRNTDTGTLAGDKTTVEKTSDITFGKFPHAGEYVYTVKETKETKEGVEYSEDTYTLRVYVKNGADGPEIQNMTAEKGTSSGIKDNKVEKIVFTNTYRKNAALTITNNTTGDLADKTKDFNFTIKIIPSAMEVNPDSYTGKLVPETTVSEITAPETTVTVKANTLTTFDLHDGEALRFDSLPAGTRYVVTEKGEEGYKPSVKVVENNFDKVNKNAEVGEGISSADGNNTNLVGENTNTVTFTNTYNPVPMTGIIMKNLPFILVIGIAVLALGALAILKRQRLGSR